MTDTTPHDAWTPEVGDDVEDRRTGSVAAVTAVSDRPTVFLRFKGSGVTTVVPLPALRRTYRPAAPTLEEATVTDTTQPDPQVVAWEYAMVLTWPDGYEIDGRTHGEISADPARDFLGSTDGREARMLYRRRPAGEWEPAPSKPLTVADVPAGQGVASLFIASDADGKPSLWRQRTVGAPEVVYRPPSHGSKGEALLWALIESHVATVTAEEHPVNRVRVIGGPDTTSQEATVTVQPTDARPGLSPAHLPFIARLINVADQAGVTIVYCCLNVDWGVMTTPRLDDEAGAAFLARLGVGDVEEPEQADGSATRTIFAGPHLAGGVRLYLHATPTGDDTTKESK